MSSLPTIRAYHRSDTTKPLAGDVAGGVLQLEHEILRAGPYRMTWRFEEGQRGVSRRGLDYWFDGLLMARIVSDYGGVTVFEGRVWEMTLEADGMRLTKSMEGFANSVAAEYTSATTGNATYTEYATNTDSIAEYGQFDAIVRATTESATEAEALRDSELEMRANPYNLPPIFTEAYDQPAALEVTVVGRSVLANGRYILPGGLDDNDDGTTPTVSEVIEAIVTDYCGDWLSIISITENDTETAWDVPRATPAWDRLAELAQLQDSDGNRSEMIVTPEGGLIYQQLDTTPIYERHMPPVGIVWPSRKTPTWDARPGVVRLYDRYAMPPLPDTGLDDPTLAIIERVTMRQDAARASYHSSTLNEDDWRLALDAHTRWLERLAESDGGRFSRTTVL